MKRITFLILLLLLFPGCGGGSRTQAIVTSAPQVLNLTGDVEDFSDPTIIKAGGMYYVFGGSGKIRRSGNMLLWTEIGRVFPRQQYPNEYPDWVLQLVPNAEGGIWAPDISYYNGKYQLYYAVSSFGSSDSCIGLATNKTLDTSSADYEWMDQGDVICSGGPGEDWNAIDPNFMLDENGDPWLAFGSFGSGIKLVRIDKDTGKPAEGAALVSIAERQETAIDRDGLVYFISAIEAPFIIRRNNYFYLFVSFDLCCLGINSSYNIRVGRSTQLQGPYLDRDERDMLSGGGTLVLQGKAPWYGPGHNAVLQESSGDKLVYHAYDGNNNGAVTLRISEISWDNNGWPSAGGP